MSVFSKIFGKKRTVDTSNPQHMQPQPMVAPGQHNEQANQFNDFEIINALPDGEQVADVYLNVDTESKSRTYMMPSDWKNMNVGHTWLSIKPIQSQLPADLDNQVRPQTRALINAHGQTAIGFWPVTVRTKSTDRKKLSDDDVSKIQEDNSSIVAEFQNREAKGLTRGSGTITREEAPQHNLHQTVVGKDTEGVVEEPDDAHSPKGRKVFRITRKQFRNLYRYIDEHRNHKYNLYSYNCSTFAVHALREAGQTVSYDGITMPNNLYESMYVEAKKHAKEAEKAKKRGRKIEKSKVELLKLAEGESHRAMGKTKQGENGKDVRVKGVDKFDIPMFTDPLETALKQIINKGGEITVVDKSGFSQLIFRDCKDRTLDAIDAYTQKAVEIGLMVPAERNATMDFYLKGYHLIDDPKYFTSDPELFKNYMVSIVETVPNTETFNRLMDGNTLSPEHEKTKLVDRFIWNVLNSNKQGDDFRQYIEPVIELKFQEALSEPMNEAFIKALQHYTKNYRRSDLKRIQCLQKDVFAGHPNVENAVYNYFKNYYNLRITKKLTTEQDFNDAREFGEETHIQRVVDSIPIIGRSVLKSQNRKFYRTITDENGNSIDLSPHYYKKAKKQANAPKPDENEIVAEAYLNVDTSELTKDRPELSRSNLTTDVGHTWLTLKAKPQEGHDQGKLPVDLENEIQQSATGQLSVNLIRAKGETAMGFYPLQNNFNATSGLFYKMMSPDDQQNAVEKNVIQQAYMDVRRYKGYTRGGGSVVRTDTKHTGFNPVKDVDGRVEEPDDHHSPKGRKRFTLTRKQFRKMYKYIESHRNHRYNLGTYNCTTFATHALREAGHHASGSRFGICYPAKMYRELYNEAKRNAAQNRVGDVQLLKLADGESHGEHRPGKIGETGVDVRVPGVEKFDMVYNYTDIAEVILRKIVINPEKRAQYVKDFVRNMITGYKSRSKADAIRITEEAARLQVIKPKVADAIKKLYNHYCHLSNHFEEYVTMPPSMQYDYLHFMKLLIDDKEVYKDTYTKIGAVAGKMLEYPIDSEEYKIGCKLLSETGIGFDKFIIPALNRIKITPDVALTCIHMNVQMYYTEKNRIIQIILQANQNDPNLACQFLLNSFDNPEFDDYGRSVLADFLMGVAGQHPDKTVLVKPVEELKANNKIDENTYNILHRYLTAKQQDAEA